MSTQATLSAASNDRKARLAQLKSLKRRQAAESQQQQDGGEAAPPADADTETVDQPQDKTTLTTSAQASLKRPRSPSPSSAALPTLPETPTYLSGRNYDATTRGPKLGFETLPNQTATETVETAAARLAAETKAQREAEEAAEKPLDLFKLRPKKPNWDLKRDLEKKLKVLDVRTENAIARLVRERVAEAKRREVESEKKGKGDGGAESGEAVGMEGNALVEAMHLREREEEAEERREREEEVVDGEV